MSSSHVVLLTPITDIQRVTLSLTSCPSPPRPQRAGLSARFQASQVHSLFAALPFDCNGREYNSRNNDSTCSELRPGENVLKPRPLYNTSTLTPRIPHDIEGQGCDQQSMSSADAVNIGAAYSMMDGIVAINKVNEAQSHPTVRPGSLLDLMDYMQCRANKQTSRRPFTNTAA